MDLNSCCDVVTDQPQSTVGSNVVPLFVPKKVSLLCSGEIAKVRQRGGICMRTYATIFAQPIKRQCLSIRLLSAIFSPISVHAGLVN